MKRILLISLLMFNASLLDAMANPAVILQASALLRRNLQIVDADVSIEHRDDGTFVHYLRNGQEMAVFNADLLKKSGVIQDIIEDLGSSDETLVAIVKHLFDRLSDIEQIKLAIQALDANNQPSEQGGIDDSAKQFVDQLQPKDLAWLANWTDEWQINFVYNALVAKIASDIHVVSDLYNSGQLKDEIVADVSDKIDMNTVYDLVFKRLTREIVPQSWKAWMMGSVWIGSAVYNQDGSQILVGADRRAMIYDLQGNLIQVITPQLEQYEWIRSAVYSPDGSHILVWTNNNRMMIYDLRGNLIRFIVPQLQQGEWINSAVYSPDRSRIIVWASRRVMIYDPQGNLIRVITPQLLQGEWISSAIYNSDGSQIFVGTTQRVMFYDRQGNLVQTITPSLQRDAWIRSVAYNPDRSRILVWTSSNSRVMIYDLQGNLIQVINPQLQQDESFRSAVYSSDGSHILVWTNNNRMMIYDLQGNLIQVITPQLEPGRSIESAVYSPDGAQILVSTSRRVIMYPNPTNLKLAQLNLAQKILLLKASKSWKVGGSYSLNFDDLEIYESLPSVFKDKKLFELPADEGCVIS